MIGRITVKKRIWRISILFIIAFIVLMIRIFYLQVFRGGELSMIGQEQQSADRNINPKRGTIYDATGQTILAQSSSVEQVTVNPKNIKEKEKVAKKLSELFDLDYDKTLKKLQKKVSIVNIAKKVEKEKTNDLRKWMAQNNITEGINIDEDTKRYYPFNNLASQVIGFCGGDNQGLNGIEAKYDEVLKGKQGHISKITDAKGEKIEGEEEKYINPVDGDDIVLTIDATIQGIAEKYLKQSCIDNNCENGGNVIIMNPKNGEVLAMAGYPNYNLNDPFNNKSQNNVNSNMDNSKEVSATISNSQDSDNVLNEGKNDDALDKENNKEENNQEENNKEKDKKEENNKEENNKGKNNKEENNKEKNNKEKDNKEENSNSDNNQIQELWRNKAISDTYEPGSTFKVVTTSIALQESMSTPDKEGEFCCVGYIEVAGVKMKCWRYYKPHGSESLRQALMNSCNPVFIGLGEKIGVSTYYKYLNKFGFFNKTGIDLPGEANSIFLKENKVGPVELGTIAFGQRFEITPIQMATMLSTIANNGKYIKPHIVKKIISNSDVDENGNRKVTEIQKEEGEQVITEQNAKSVLSMMQSVVDEGTGKKAKIEGIAISGKTGTSEDGVHTGKYIASFISTAPTDNPKIVVLVTLYNPKGEGGHSGGGIAAPLAGSIIKEVLEYLK